MVTQGYEIFFDGNLPLNLFGYLNRFAVASKHGALVNKNKQRPETKPKAEQETKPGTKTEKKPEKKRKSKFNQYLRPLAPVLSTFIERYDDSSCFEVGQKTVEKILRVSKWECKEGEDTAFKPLFASQLLNLMCDTTQEDIFDFLFDYFHLHHAC